MVCILKLFSHLCSFVSSKNHFRHIYFKLDPIHTQRMCAHIHTSTHIVVNIFSWLDELLQNTNPVHIHFRCRVITVNLWFTVYALKIQILLRFKRIFSLPQARSSWIRPCPLWASPGKLLGLLKLGFSLQAIMLAVSRSRRYTLQHSLTNGNYCYKALKQFKKHTFPLALPV